VPVVDEEPCVEGNEEEVSGDEEKKEVNFEGNFVEIESRAGFHEEGKDLRSQEEVDEVGEDYPIRKSHEELKSNF
jgi:hypothetical protein